MTTETTELLEALRNLPSDSDMIEHNPDEGMSLHCCGGDVYMAWRGDDRVEHATDCWFVRLRAAGAAFEAAQP